MAVYTTFFLCRPEDLPAWFPGWKLPLQEPVTREFRNPYTGKVRTVVSRTPDWPEAEEEEAAAPVARVVEINGRYEDYLESRLPAPVRNAPHWAAKGLTSVELGPLLKLLGAAPKLDEALFAPPRLGACVEKLPDEFSARLAGADLNHTAEEWAAAMSAPEHTHSASGLKLSDGWRTTDAAAILGPLVALARQASTEDRLYLLTAA